MPTDPLVREFAVAPLLFATSPLYGRFGAVVAADERLLEIAGHARGGQVASNMLWAAVHYLLLRDPRHALAAWYPSVGGDATGDPGRAFTAFCLEHRDEIIGLMRTRLVQTNVVKRSAVLRFGLAEVASMTDEPVTLIEIGCSAGAHLRFDEYRYEIGGRTWGRASSPVVIRTEWRGAGPPPDLDRLPVIADRCGIDLNPIDAGDPDERLWLRALIWPENGAHADLQEEALRVVAADPPRVVAGDAVEVLRGVVAGIPRGTPVVIFHAATRLHVPADRRGRFDAAIAVIARDHELFHLSFEASRRLEPPNFALELRREDAAVRLLASGDGHAEWIRDR